MRKLILQEFVSLDGFAADNEGKTSFFEDLTSEKGRDIDHDLVNFMSLIDTILLGANTYKMFIEYWPKATTDEEPMADLLNKTHKVVVSSSLKEAPWGNWKPADIISRDVVSEIKKLKKQPGKDIVLWGSVSLAQSLIKENLIDEIQLRVCPVFLGEGKSLFNREGFKLKLIDTKTYAAGVVLLRYFLL